jgi:hypothetical protein
MRASNRFILRSESAHVGQRPDELGFAILRDARETADEPHPDCGESVQVESRPIWRAGKLQGWNPPSSADVVDFVIPLIQYSDGVHPPLNVFAAMDARRSKMLADRQNDRVTRAMELKGDLSAAR